MQSSRQVSWLGLIAIPRLPSFLVTYGEPLILTVAGPRRNLTDFPFSPVRLIRYRHLLELCNCHRGNVEICISKKKPSPIKETVMYTEQPSLFQKRRKRSIIQWQLPCPQRAEATQALDYGRYSGFQLGVLHGPSHLVAVDTCPKNAGHSCAYSNGLAPFSLLIKNNHNLSHMEFYYRLRAYRVVRRLSIPSGSLSAKSKTRPGLD